MDLELMKGLAIETPTKIVMLVMDGLGGLPHPQTGKSELETARTPNLDALASVSACGLTDPVSPGITPGSGPGHLALFGYDPVRYQIGRGVLEALGVDFPLQPQDVAARGNFCTVDAVGRVTDRRAGRISTQQNRLLCQRLRQIGRVDGVEVFIEPGMEYRWVAVFRGPHLSDALTETDPQREGLPPKPVQPLSLEAAATAQAVNSFIARARELLADAAPANMVLLRGFSKYPTFPAFGEIFKLKGAAIAVYPMYRGLAKLVGMEVLNTGTTLEEELATLKASYEHYDFFFVHYKKTDSAGEDGDFPRKVQAIEEADALLPQLTALHPDVLIVTGDHATPAVLKGHSWHPVPLILYAENLRTPGPPSFSEAACRQGVLGRIAAKEVMPLAMANALKFVRYGA